MRQSASFDLHYGDFRGGHDIWTTVYNTPAMYDWMFSHGAVPEPSTLVLVVFALAFFGLTALRRRPDTVSVPNLVPAAAISICY
jgi:hypothetical protein